MSRHHADAEVVAGIETFCREVLTPRAAAIDESSLFATCHRAALGDMGVMGLNLPAEYGGPGVDAWTLFESIALVAGACGSTASMVTAHWLATDSIVHGGSAGQKQRWLPLAATGERLGAFALTEPGAGSNPADMTTCAVREGDGWRIRGTKHFISNAGEADFIVVYAKTDRAAGARGISAFVVEPAAGGVTVGGAERTMGLKGGHVFEVVFDCLVPDDNRLGPEGSGFRTALKTLDAGRLDIAACAVGIAEAAFAAARDWARTRMVDGHPIAAFQGLQWMIADMAVDIAAARGLADAATAKRAARERYSPEAAMVKLFAAEMAGRVTDKALQIHGGYGFTRDLPLERYVRDVRIFRIYEGSSEVQRNIIARAALA
ncbi:acyl-CoA dehydrogenase family protein [Pseudoxanthobacter sp.]|uniref:acyl-CoA dehydrogenase family protein n=1 Tax=Pseudoxanthobacter sp. TaxID=1925742 RepID=UPI002FDFAA36